MEYWLTQPWGTFCALFLTNINEKSFKGQIPDPHPTRKARPCPTSFCLRITYNRQKKKDYQSPREKKLTIQSYRNTKALWVMCLEIAPKRENLTSAPTSILRGLWSTLLESLTSLTEERKASGYKIDRTFNMSHLSS